MSWEGMPRGKHHGGFDEQREKDEIAMHMLHDEPMYVPRHRAERRERERISGAWSEGQRRRWLHPSQQIPGHPTERKVRRFC